ncbi:hypothetical protein PQX77_014647 [Marasmius sp. AFHP31]|nr:hypothetical protein PQX77_014647 [Marasmius sp. AFHP31]
MPKGSRVLDPKLSSASKPKDKLKAPKASQQTYSDESRGKIWLMTTGEDTSLWKPLERATKSQAKEIQTWMDPNMGAWKGKGATHAHKALKRERALSNATEASKAKRARAVLEEGRGTPKPSEFYKNYSDNDIIMGELTGPKGFCQKQASHKNSTKITHKQMRRSEVVAQTQSKRFQVQNDDGSDCSSVELDYIQSDASECHNGSNEDTTEESDA